MDSTSTTSAYADNFGELGEKSFEWARVDIGPLSGFSAREVLAGDVEPLLPVVNAEARGKIGDLIGTGYATIYLVTPMFIAVVDAAGLTGCKFLPIEVVVNDDMPDLFLLQVLGRCGPIVEVGPERQIGIESWDGSDFFLAEKYLATFVSPRAGEVLRKARLRNVEVRAPQTIGVDAVRRTIDFV